MSIYLHCEKGNVAGLRRLMLTKGADVNKKNNQRNKRTCLHIAAAHGQVEVMRLLIFEGNADTTITNDYGETCLHDATINNQLEAMRLLIFEAKADINCKEDSGEQPIHYAAMEGLLDALKLLVNEAKADPNSKDNHGYTPLMFAMFKDHLDCVKFLVEDSGCDIWLKNNHGETALDMAKSFQMKDNKSKLYLQSLMEDAEGGLTMTKSAAFDPSKKKPRTK